MMFKKLNEFNILKKNNSIRWFKKTVVLLVIINLILPINIVKAVEDKGELLIIYDDYKEYVSEVNNLNHVIKAGLTTGKSIELRKSNSYTKEDLNKAEGIIVLSNRDGGFNKSQIDELYLNSKKLLWIGKNSSNKDVISLSFKNLEDVLKINKIIYNKFVNELNKERNCYLVLDEVYPYDDLNLIIEKADYLYDLGIPFLVTAMEVYNNLEFDSMKRYTETLRYCASKGGTIILGDPYLYDKGPTEDALIENIGIAQNGFINNKVYPIGLTINDSYLYRYDREKYLKNTSIVIINENENLGVIDFESLSIKEFNNALIKINGELINFSNGLTKDLLNNVAIGVVGKENINDFKKKIDLYKRNDVKFSNPRNLNGELTFGSNKINNRENGILVNGVNLGGNRFLSNEELYENSEEFKIDEEEKKVEKVENENIDLGQANIVIFLIALMGVVIFIIFFLYSLKIDKKKYFK